MTRNDRDMQLAPYNIGPAGYGAGYGPGALAPWDQPSAGGALGAAGAPPAPTPLRKMHRLLRGRYVLAVFLALLGAAAGGVAGYMSQKPQYSSTGIIAISGLLPSPDHRDMLIQMYAQHMARQVSWLTSERLLKLGVRNVPVVNNQQEFRLIGAVPRAEALGLLSEAISARSAPTKL